MRTRTRKPPLKIPQRSSKPPLPALAIEEEGETSHKNYRIIKGSHFRSTEATEWYVQFLSTVYLYAKLTTITYSYGRHFTLIRSFIMLTYPFSHRKEFIIIKGGGHLESPRSTITTKGTHNSHLVTIPMFLLIAAIAILPEAMSPHPFFLL